MFSKDDSELRGDAGVTTPLAIEFVGLVTAVLPCVANTGFTPFPHTGAGGGEGFQAEFAVPGWAGLAATTAVVGCIGFQAPVGTIGRGTAPFAPAKGGKAPGPASCSPSRPPLSAS